MIALPTSAECRCLLADGQVLTILATRRARGNRAEVKCAVPGAAALSERMLTAVRLARLTEARFDSRDQVMLSMDIQPPALERGWELAAVLADRMVRGLYHAGRAPVFADGWSDAWQLGRVDGQPAAALARLRAHPATAGANLIIGGAAADCAAATGATYLPLSHLGALTGHADPAAAVSSARAWFPLHSGGANDSLAWVEVSVYPLAPSDLRPAGEEEPVAAPQLDLAAQAALRQALTGARHFDGRGLGRWRTVVGFSQPRFQGSSYELALVMADRLARGREFVPRGRLIASGCSAAWHAGRVDSVEGRAAKMALIAGEAAPGDRILLPLAWQADSAPADLETVRARGASLAWIASIGMI